MDKHLDTRPNVILDWSVISRKCWSRMQSANYETITGDEIADFTINSYGYLLFLQERFNPKNIYFALDSRPNWRDQYYKDYYVKNSEILQLYVEDSKKKKVFNPRQEYIVKFDQKSIRYWYSADSRKWMMKKMLKADVEKTDWDAYRDVNLALYVEIREELEGKDVSTKERRAIREEYVRSKREEILYTTLKGNFPAYKGKRSKQKWTAATPKHGYVDENGDKVLGYYDYSEALAKQLAGTFGGKTVKADNAEADDVIAFYVKNNKSPRDLVLVSIDSDLHQLYLDNIRFKYYNPNRDALGYSPWGDFVELNAKDVKYDLITKLMMGDDSDNVPGCMHYDKKGNLKKTLVTERVVDEIMENCTPADVPSLMEPNSFARNRKLVHLDNIPKSVNENIKKAFLAAKVTKKPIPHKDYMLPAISKLEIKEAAKTRRGGNINERV